MGSSAHLYSLGWSDFDSSLKLAVKGLRSRGDLVDVTLSAGGKSFPAHKLVLSAASSLFLELLKVSTIPFFCLIENRKLNFKSLQFMMRRTFCSIVLAALIVCFSFF